MKLKSKRFTLVVAIAGMSMFSNAQAVDQYCSGLVSDHLVYSNGTLMIRAPWLNEWTYLCNLQSPWKGVSTEACFTWFSLVTAARANNKPVGAYYQTQLTCATLGTYENAPAPMYLRMGE
jgi:hypothetical protein